MKTFNMYQFQLSHLLPENLAYAWQQIVLAKDVTVVRNMIAELNAAAISIKGALRVANNADVIIGSHGWCVFAEKHVAAGKLCADLVSVSYDITLAAIEKKIVANLSFEERRDIEAVCTRMQYAMINVLCTVGFEYKGIRYLSIGSSPGQLKKGACYCLSLDLFAKEKEAWWCGAKPGDNWLLCKLWASRMFNFSNAEGVLEDVNGVAATVDDVIIVKDVECDIHVSDAVNITTSYEITRGEETKSFACFDGEGIYDARRWGNVNRQVRPWAKGLIVAVSFGYIERNYSGDIVDFWGKQHNIFEEKISIILTESQVKNIKFFTSLEDWRTRTAKIYGRELYTCHTDPISSNKAISRQMFQNLPGLTDAEIEDLTHFGIEAVDSLTSVDGARKALKGKKAFADKDGIQKLVSSVEFAVAIPAIYKRAEAKYTAMRNKLMSGKIPVHGRYHYIATDPIAFMDIYFGGKNVNDPDVGCMEAGTVLCNQYKNTVYPKLSMARSPMVSFGWVTRDLVSAEDKRAWLINNDAAIFAINDPAFYLFDNDFDGDEILVIADNALANAVDRIRKDYNYGTPLMQKDKAPATPLPTTAKTMADAATKVMIDNMNASKDGVGPMSNLATKILSYLTQNPSGSAGHVANMYCAGAAAILGVDYAKTGVKHPISANIKKQYKYMPSYHLYKDPDYDNQVEEHPEAVVARSAAYVGSKCDAEYSMSGCEDLVVDYQMLVNHDEHLNVNPVKHAVSDDLIARIRKIGCVNNIVDDEYKAAVLNGTPTLRNLFTFLFRQNSAFWKESSREDNILAKQQNINVRVEETRRILRDFVMLSSAEATEKLSAHDRDVIVANILTKTLLAGKKNVGDAILAQEFFITCYGDILVESYKKNIEEGRVAVSESFEEFMNDDAPVDGFVQIDVDEFIYGDDDTAAYYEF